MAGGGGSGSQTTQTQSADPWSGAQGYLRDAYSQAQTAAQRTNTSPYEGSFVNPANATQRTAVDMARTAAGGLDTGGAIRNVANESLSGNMLSANPYVQQAIDGTIRPTIDRTVGQLLPGVSSAAQEAGAYGGSRHALAQRWITDDATRNAGDIAAGLWNQNYQNERNIQTQVAPQMLQQANQMSMAPAQAMLEVGQQQYALDDLVRQNSMLSFEDEINSNWRAINPYIAALSGIGMPGGTTSITSTGAKGMSPGAAAASGALGGAAAGTAVMPGWGTAIGALIGGGAGYFGAR